MMGSTKQNTNLRFGLPECLVCYGQLRLFTIPRDPSCWGLGDHYATVVVPLVSNGSWAHYSHTFTAAGTAPFRLMVDDFRAPGENAYFDNFSFRSVPDTDSTAFFVARSLCALARIGQNSIIKLL